MHKFFILVSQLTSLKVRIVVYTKNSVIQTWMNTDPSLERFNVLEQRMRLAPSTHRTYVKHVKAFVDWFEANSPKQAIEKLLSMKVDERMELVDGFIGALLGRGMSTGACVELVRGGFKKWLKVNEVEMNWDKIQAEYLPGKEALVSDRMPTKEELRQLLNIGGLRDSVMTLVLTSSGLRIGALASLKLGDISLDEEIPRIVVKRKPGRKISRKMKAFATFITLEAKKVLLQYIEHREKMGEKITENSPILTSDRENELGNFLSSTYLSNHWRRLLKRAHLATKNGGPWHDIHLHTLRKYFETMCVNAGVKTAYREFWMGHIGRHIEESYFRGEVETHIQEYKKAIPYLSVLEPAPENLKALTEKVRYLEENGKRKEAEIQKLRNQLVEQENLKKRLAKVESLLEKILEEKA